MVRRVECVKHQAFPPRYVTAVSSFARWQHALLLADLLGLTAVSSGIFSASHVIRAVVCYSFLCGDYKMLPGTTLSFSRYPASCCYSISDPGVVDSRASAARQGFSESLQSESSFPCLERENLTTKPVGICLLGAPNVPIAESL